MATSNWSVPTGKTINGSTKIKDTDNHIADTIQDLVDWCNNTNGAFNDWTSTGLRTDFVDKGSSQIITGAKTFSNPIVGNVTGNVTGNASTATTLTGLTSTVAELNKLDGFTGTNSDLNYAKDLRATGVTATEFDHLDGVSSNLQTQLNSKQNSSTAVTTTSVQALHSSNALDVSGSRVYLNKANGGNEYIDIGHASSSVYGVVKMSLSGTTLTITT